MRRQTRLTPVAAAIVSLLAASAIAQEPPYLVFTPEVQARVDAKVAANHPDWQYFNTFAGRPDSCPYRIQPAPTPDGLPNVYAPRDVIPPDSPTGSVERGYLGAGYLNHFFPLGICWHATKDTDPPTAEKYKTQLLKILRANSMPFATVTPSVPNPRWRAVGTDPQPGSKPTRSLYYVDNTGPGGQARADLSYHWLSTGDVVTIEGVLGCTSANGLRRVTYINKDTFDLVEMDGTTPVICNAPGENRNERFQSYRGTYAMRHTPKVLVYGLSWFWNDLTEKERHWAWATLNEWFSEYTTIFWTSTNNQYAIKFLSNYTQGYAGSLAAMAAVSKGVNPWGGSFWYDYFKWWTTEIQAKFFANKWLRNNAGNYESWHYHSGGWPDGMLDFFDAYGEDPTSDWDPPLHWVADNALYFIHNTAPNLRHGALRGFNFGYTFWTRTNPGYWAEYPPDAFWQYLDAVGHPEAPRLLAYIRELRDLNEQPDGFRQINWFRMLYEDGSSAALPDWRTGLPLSDPQGSSPHGGYLRVVGRSDWTTSAVAFDLFFGPYVSGEGNSKEHYDQGALYLQKGDNYLLVPPMAAAAREECEACYLYTNRVWTREQNRDVYGIYYAERQAGPYTHVPDFNRENGQPGKDIPAPWEPGGKVNEPTNRIDRYEDRDGYVYMRGVDHFHHYGNDHSIKTERPVGAWDREVVYVRPDVFVVYDRTRKDEVATEYEQFMAWSVGKTPTVAAYGPLWRTTSSDGSTFKGALTHVLPADMPQPFVRDVELQGDVFQVRTRPGIESHGANHRQYVNWLTVAQPTDDPAGLLPVARLQGDGIDAVGVGGIVIGFPSHDADGLLALPVTYSTAGMAGASRHIIAGLDPGASYGALVSGQEVVITAGGALQASSAGVLEFEAETDPGPCDDPCGCEPCPPCDPCDPGDPGGGLEADEDTVGLWRFDGSLDGVVADRDLVESGSLDYGPALHDQGIDFDFGSYAYYPEDPADPDAFDFGLNDFTIEAIMQVRGNGSYERLVSKRAGASGATPPHWELMVRPASNVLYCRLADGVNQAQVSVGVPGLANEWHHIACVFKRGSVAEIWVDGALKKSGSIAAVTGSVSNSDPLTIGVSANGTSQPTGAGVDEVRISSVARSFNQ